MIYSIRILATSVNRDKCWLREFKSSALIKRKPRMGGKDRLLTRRLRLRFWSHCETQAVRGACQQSLIASNLLKNLAPEF